jgi:hypothetical protein
MERRRYLIDGAVLYAFQNSWWQGRAPSPITASKRYSQEVFTKAGQEAIPKLICDAGIKGE